MTDTITITGVAGRAPELRTGDKGSWVTLSVATNRRVKDQATGEWKDLDTNWYKVVAFRRLAEHVNASVNKGDRLIITGRLSVREYEKQDGTKGTAVEIVADAIGHDLNSGTTTLIKGTGGNAPAVSDDSWSSSAESVWPDVAHLPDEAPF